MLPLIVPAIPFGLVLGVAINESTINPWIGWAASSIVFAGSAQLASLQVLDQGAGIFLVAFTIWVINARHIMYSGALAARYEQAPRWWKFLTSYVLIDQTFALVDPMDTKENLLPYRMGYLLGAGGAAWVLWQLWVLLGVLVGDVIPQSWSLDFAVPILFLTLMVLATTNLAATVAAIVGGVTAVLAVDFPQGTGLLLGAILGIIAGGLVDWWQASRRAAS